MTFKEFLLERVETIKPRWDVASPVYLLRALNKKQWKFLMIGFWSWTWDAFDFFSIAVLLPTLKKAFNASDSEIVLGLVLSLLPRVFGAAIFGIAADRYGRRWPFIVNCICLMVLELSIALCRTYPQFLACRILFGLAMGGMYGNASATALEDCPDISRGIVSGIFMAGYPMGLLLATAFKALLVDHTTKNWRTLFYFGAAPPALLIGARLLLPETEAFEEKAISTAKKSIRGFVLDFIDAISRHWKTLAYLTVWILGCTYLSHGSQDILHTLLSNKYSLPELTITKLQVTGFSASILGSLLMGFISDVIGRRFTIVVCCICAGALVYPYSYLSIPGLYPIIFLNQFFIQGIFGIVPVHLIELSPPAFRTFVVGTAYNLGIFFSSPVPIIETRIGLSRPLPNGENGMARYDYSFGIAMVFGCGVAFTTLTTFLGPEN
ncbi:lactate/pyruvate transporter, partial [Tricladium varicosporioides]